jgi:replicative DNA helicase
MTAKPPPWDKQAEDAVISAMLCNPDAIDVVMDHLRPEDFFDQRNAKVLAAGLRLAECGSGVDAVSVASALRDFGELDQAGGMQRLVELCAEPIMDNLETHCRRVAVLARVRRLLDAAAKVTAEGHARQEDLAGWCERAEQLIFEAGQGVNPEGATRQIPELLGEVSDDISAREQTDDAPTGFVRIMWPSLRRKLGGWMRSKLIIIAGRPGMGKSVLALEAARMTPHNESVLVVGLEATNAEQGQRMLAAESAVKVETIMRGRPNHDEWSRIIDARHRLRNSSVSVAYRPGCTLTKLRSLVRREMARLKRAEQPPLRMLIVDYLQIMAANVRRDGTREEEVSTLTRGLLQLAGEFDLAVLAVSQLNRSVDSRVDKRPLLSDLRESGAIEQDAYAVLMLYRDEYYHEETDDSGTIEVLIRKHRNGPTGWVKLGFTGEFCRIRELPDGYEDLDAPYNQGGEIYND